MKSPISTAVAILAGLLALLGYFFPVFGLGDLRSILINWAVILAAIATLIGVANLLSVHFQKLTQQETNNGYSLVVIAGFMVPILLGVYEGIFNPGSGVTEQVVNAIQIPVEGSLMAVLAASLAFASIRLLSRRRDMFTIIFFASTVIFLFLASGVLGMLNFSGTQVVQDFLNRLPVAGGRGLLLGVALGSLLTGLRILVGADRPYRG